MSLDPLAHQKVVHHLATLSHHTRDTPQAVSVALSEIPLPVLEEFLEELLEELNVGAWACTDQQRLLELLH